MCTGWNNFYCSACSNGFWLQANINRCDTYCDPGYAPPNGAATGTCALCYAWCTLCTSTLNGYCTACQAGYTLKNGFCTTCTIISPIIRFSDDST